MLNTGNRVHQMCHGELTATILRARWERANPDGVDAPEGHLDWEQAKGIGAIDIVDAVHAEWAEMPDIEVVPVYDLSN